MALGMCKRTGTPWGDHKVLITGGVLFIVFEGLDRAPRDIFAWCVHHGLYSIATTNSGMQYITVKPS